MHRAVGLIGIIEAEQTEHGRTVRNDRPLAVAANSTAHRSMHDLRDLSPDLVAQIEHFFASYHEMKGQRFTVKGRSFPACSRWGDVRHGSVKRLAQAVGEGSVEVESVHQHLAAHVHLDIN